MGDSSANPTFRASLASLPKIDLHRHLEGSLRLTTLREVALQYDLNLPAETLESLRPYVQIGMQEEHTFRRFLDKFEVLRRFYRSPQIIRRVAFEAIEDAARDNVRYLELRFTPPALAKSQSYPLAEVADWVLDAVEQACQVYPAVRVRLIVTLNRHEPVQLAEQVTQIAIDRRSRGIVGLDLAGDEVNFPTAPFRGVFRAASEAGLGLVAHAGEWTSAEAVREVIEDLGVCRVGHGVRVVDDPRVASLARERGVVFEVCLTSNLQSGVIERIADHPLRAMTGLRVLTTLNTDDPAVSGITLSDEYAAAIDDLGCTEQYIQQAILTAANAILAPESDRAQLVADFQEAFAADSTDDVPQRHPLPVKGRGPGG
jgi:adenosine deaminase